MKSTISKSIPLSIPELGGNEWKYVKQCLDTNWVSSVGSFVNDFEDALAQYTGSPYAVATVNGTAALHISLILAGVEAGDYVIVPNITFIASANAVTYAGAMPLLVDVKADTWQMDLDLLEDFFTHECEKIGPDLCYKKDQKRIKAIMPVHVLGNMADMDQLVSISQKFGIPLVEDASESLGSTYKGKHAGTFGDLGCISFNGNKIITTGGGGMILCKDKAMATRAKHLTTQAKSDPFAYMHDEIGYNYRMVNILAAMGMAQMEQLPEFLAIKRRNAALYQELLQEVEGISFQAITPHVQPNQWLFSISSPDQPELIAHLLEQKIQTRPLWVPMNQLPMFAHVPYVQTQDHAHSIHARTLSLPSSSSLTEEDVRHVCQQIKSVFR